MKLIIGLFPYLVHVLISIPSLSWKWENINERKQNMNTALTKTDGIVPPFKSAPTF